MNGFISPPRYETRVAIERVDRLLHLSNSEGEPQQDWELLVADPSRLAEFCNLYESGVLDAETQFALMRLIVATLDELSAEDTTETTNIGLAQRVERLLRQDFVLHLHTIHYWSLLDEADRDNVFTVTPLLRRVWNDCFKPEYQQWLDRDSG